LKKFRAAALLFYLCAVARASEPARIDWKSRLCGREKLDECDVAELAFLGGNHAADKLQARRMVG
jgi:hypothetical protein